MKNGYGTGFLAKGWILDSGEAEAVSRFAFHVPEND